METMGIQWYSSYLCIISVALFLFGPGMASYFMVVQSQSRKRVQRLEISLWFSTGFTTSFQLVRSRHIYSAQIGGPWSHTHARQWIKRCRASVSVSSKSKIKPCHKQDDLQDSACGIITIMTIPRIDQLPQKLFPTFIFQYPQSKPQWNHEKWTVSICFFFGNSFWGQSCWS